MSDIQAPLPGHMPPPLSSASVQPRIDSGLPEHFLAGHAGKLLGTSARSSMLHLFHLSDDQQRRECCPAANTPADIAPSAPQYTYNQGSLGTANNNNNTFR